MELGIHFFFAVLAIIIGILVSYSFILSHVREVTAKILITIYFIILVAIGTIISIFMFIL
jgi:hypothetical protein